MSRQDGQNNLTVSMAGQSDLPMGTTAAEWQNTRGQCPKDACSYLSACKNTLDEVHLIRDTIACRPARLMIHR